MRYSLIADAYERIEDTSKRLEMTDHLVHLLQRTPRDLVAQVVYLTRGKLYPDFTGIQIGFAEKLAVRAVARATGLDEGKIQEDLRKTGDLGQTTRRFLETKKQARLVRAPLTAQVVYESLDQMANTTGAGSTVKKINLLTALLSRATPKEAKYIVRTVTGRLRLGIADMTVLDALAVAYGGGKEARKALERAYNISSDLGKVARTIVGKGMEGIQQFEVSVGEPIRPMLAERLSFPREILEKLGGRCIAEFKYDGERLQVHKRGDHITLFSRRLENITNQYPDGAELIKKYVTAKDAIVEAECVAVEPETGEIRPFQELMHRRRKHGIQKIMEEYPVSLYMFEALYVDGEDLTLKPYPIRHGTLERIIQQSVHIQVADYLITSHPEELESFFERAIESGCEGLVCKSMNDDSVYQAGARGWLWIKYKRDYKTDMIDTVDLVVVGAFYGRGKRAGKYGALLLSSYDAKKDIFETVTKCGTGFTDLDLGKLPKILDKHRIPHLHPRVTSTLEADVWFEPAVVIEVMGAEITLSPIHTCAMDVVRKGSGLAIRFPRFTGNYRPDKSAEDATTAKEIIQMYKSQRKKVSK